MQLLIYIFIGTINMYCFAQDTIRARTEAEKLIIKNLGVKKFSKRFKYERTMVLPNSNISVKYSFNIPEFSSLERRIIFVFDSKGENLKKEEWHPLINTGLPDCVNKPELCIFINKTDAFKSLNTNFDINKVKTSLSCERTYEKSIESGPDLLKGHYIWKFEVLIDKKNENEIYQIFEVHANSGNLIREYTSTCSLKIVD